MRLNYVEDVLALVAHHLYETRVQQLLGDPWFHKFIENVYGWVDQGKPLTTEQARIVLRVMEKTRSFLETQHKVPKEDIDGLLLNPSYRQRPTQSAMIPREVRYGGDNFLVFRFKRNDTIIQDIKNLANVTPFCKDEVMWDNHHRLWIAPVTRETLNPLMKLIAKHRFMVDEEVEHFLWEAANSQGEASGFAYDAGTGNILVNVRDNDLIAKWVLGALQGQRA